MLHQQNSNSQYTISLRIGIKKVTIIADDVTAHFILIKNIMSITDKTTVINSHTAPRHEL